MRWHRRYEPRTPRLLGFARQRRRCHDPDRNAVSELARGSSISGFGSAVRFARRARSIASARSFIGTSASSRPAISAPRSRAAAFRLGHARPRSASRVFRASSRNAAASCSAWARRAVRLLRLSRCFLQRRCPFRRDAGALRLDRCEPVLRCASAVRAPPYCFSISARRASTMRNTGR